MKRKKSGCLVVISGPSGAGKDTICSELLKRYKDMYLSISMTTRDKRGKEVDGKDYYFVSEKEFIDNINEGKFLEYAKVYDKYYGTLKSEVFDKIECGIDVLLVIDIQGALSIKELYKDAIFIFIMPPNLKTLIERLVKRNTDSKEKIISRFKSDYKMLNEYNKYNYVVVNDNIKDATDKVESIIVASKCSVERIEDLDLDNQEELIHELLTM